MADETSKQSGSAWARRRASSCSVCAVWERSEWCALLQPDLRELNEARTCTVYRKGQMVFHQGQPCHGIYCITSGTVALRKSDTAGNSVIVRLAESGQTLGYRAFFAGSPYADSAEAATDCAICFIERATVWRMLENNPSLGHAFLTRLARDLEESERGRLEVYTSSVRLRLAHFLLTMKDEHGMSDRDGNIVIDLPLTRQDMAATIGTRPESVSRAIKALEADRVVRFVGRKVTIEDLDRLLDEIDVDFEIRR